MEKVPLSFTALGESVSVEVDVLPEQARLDELLPVLRILDDRINEVAIRKNGQPVTCAKGCSACCRIQPVPVTPVEAYSLSLLVESMPEPRRAAVVARFRDCVSRLEDAGLTSVYLEGRPADSTEQAQANARKYLDLGLVCPFLEDDACGIYDSRPFTCRDYLVTSPKEFCSDPLSLPVRRAPTLVSGGRAMLAAEANVTGTAGYTLPLTLALAFVETCRERFTRLYDGQELFARGVRALVESSRPRSAPAHT
jgi:Fe-S-cluster containining protein